MELAPAVGPVVGDLRELRLRKGVADADGGRAVRNELDRAAALRLLEPFRRQLEEPRAQLLRRVRRRLDGGADQEKTLFSLSKKPGWWW
jgi:hypothetical protein